MEKQKLESKKRERVIEEDEQSKRKKEFKVEKEWQDEDAQTDRVAGWQDFNKKKKSKKF